MHTPVTDVSRNGCHVDPLQFGLDMGKRGPWRSLENVAFATLARVDWFNNRRLLSSIGNVPPAEAEATYYANLEELKTPPDSNQTASGEVGTVHCGPCGGKYVMSEIAYSMLHDIGQLGIALCAERCPVQGADQQRHRCARNLC